MTRPAIEALMQWRDHASSMVTYFVSQARTFPDEWRLDSQGYSRATTEHGRMAYSCAEVIEALTGGEA